jgi:transcriptional regulator with PAS, ATPase and Fis domain
METKTVTAISERGRESDSLQPALVLLLDRARPSAGGAYHSLVNIDCVRIGRGKTRAAKRIVEAERRTLKLSLPDERVSSLHARIERQGDEWRLTDCGSTNGSRVNRQEVQTTILKDGDVLEIGQTFFRYQAKVPTPVDAPGDVDASDLSGFAGVLGTLLPRLARDLERVARVAASEVSILLLGETGTGKELLARAIHAESKRTGPFVAVNCGALPATLVESLLFGHKRGAFSGATQDEPGFVRAAQSGTLFLDEVGDLSCSAQAAVLRVLQEREVTPIGATRPIPIDARIIAATHRPLDVLVESGGFRQDLLARLAGFTYALPPLRERVDDLGLLVAALLRKSGRQRATPPSLSSDAVHAIVGYAWPLNVRELEQRLKTAVVLAVDGRIELSHLWTDGRSDACASSFPSATGALSPEDAALRAELVEQFTGHRGNVTRVGEAMGKARTQIQRWVRRFGIDVSAFRR